MKRPTRKETDSFLREAELAVATDLVELERERCARIAEHFQGGWAMHGMSLEEIIVGCTSDRIAGAIADAIRDPKVTP